MCGTHARGFAYRNSINEDGEIAQQAHYFCRYTARDDRHPRQSLMVRRIHRLGPSEKG